MFAPTLEDLCREIEAAERHRDDHVKGVRRLIRDYVGRWYRGIKDSMIGEDFNFADGNPEPFCYSFISNTMPGLIFNNPAATVEARRVIGHQRVAEAMSNGLKSWMLDTPYRDEVERVVLDFLFFQGVLLHYIEDDTRWSDGTVRPNTRRIDPYKNFAADPMADSMHETEYMFHWYLADIDDLLADPDLNPDALEKLSPGNNDDEPSREPRDAFEKPTADELQRKKVKVYSIWLRRSNTLRVICKDPKIDLYPEREYYGPRTGPYEVYQAYPVPGQIYPLSPLIAVQDAIQDLQVHSKATARSAARRKTNVVVDGTVANLAETVKNSEDGEVIAIPGFSNTQVQQIELGGVEASQYNYLQFLRDRLDRQSGLTELARGQTGGSDTATEASIASEALNQRMEYLKERVRKHTSQSLTKIGWFMFHTNGIIIPVQTTDPMTGMPADGLFFGGPTPGIDAGGWDDYTIRIEPYSMQRVSEAILQRRAMEMSQFIIETAPLIPTIPWIRWMDIYKLVGEAMNHENADQFIIPELVGMMPQMDMQPPSQVTGQAQIPERYSVPGQGFKQNPLLNGLARQTNSNAAPGVDERRAQAGEVFGPMYGGTQGPPGSKQRRL